MLDWKPLSVLRERLETNLQSLRTRDAALADRLRQLEPARDHFIAAEGQALHLGLAGASGIDPLPAAVSPRSARQIASRLYPAGRCNEPVLVAGLDQGWLWSLLYQMKCATPRTPGHRPPLYFLARDLERLWLVLQVHDWRQLLADQRVRLFVGHDCATQVHIALCQNPCVPWPRLSVTIDPMVWPDGINLETMRAAAHKNTTARFNELMLRIRSVDRSTNPTSITERMSRGPLRVLGITSLYTTFLQYSMRDWLSAFEQLGHETRLLIEQQDHEIANPVHWAQVCADFRPDLILLIDHFRNELTGLPKNIPSVMWIQDRLSNIFRATAGAAQDSMDFVLGYGRQECVVTHAYPSERFMPSMVGFNPSRFVSRTLSRSEREKYDCDASFVSHASTPPEVLVQREIDKTTIPEVKRFLRDMLERLRAIYEQGCFVTEVGHVRRMVRESMRECGVGSRDPASLVDLFMQKVNNAMFRQQAITWLAEMDLDLHLYGCGWEAHPQLQRFARGIADNENQLCAIYQASRINLQMTPFGAVHQRLFDGLSAGGFFLLRHCAGDECDLLYRDMWRWCDHARIRGGEDFFDQAPNDVRHLIDRIIELTGEDPSESPDKFFLGLEEAAGAGFTRSPATLFAEYEQVSFRTREQLHALVRQYLNAPDERARIAASMRERVIQTMTYEAVTRRLLDFISRNLTRRNQSLAAAA